MSIFRSFLIILISLTCISLVIISYSHLLSKNLTNDITKQTSSSISCKYLRASNTSQKEITVQNACLAKEDDGRNMGKDNWPLGRPLPLPQWSGERPELRFASLADYDKFIWSATEHLQDTLTSQPYDSISNFIW